jgi:hypothetical protein
MVFAIVPDQHETNCVSPVSTKCQPDIQSLVSSALLPNQSLVAGSSKLAPNREAVREEREKEREENLPHGPGLDPHGYFYKLYLALAASLQHVRRIQEPGLFEPKSKEDLWE